MAEWRPEHAPAYGPTRPAIPSTPRRGGRTTSDLRRCSQRFSRALVRSERSTAYRRPDLGASRPSKYCCPASPSLPLRLERSCLAGRREAGVAARALEAEPTPRRSRTRYDHGRGAFDTGDLHTTEWSWLRMPRVALSASTPVWTITRPTIEVTLRSSPEGVGAGATPPARMLTERV